VVQRRVQQGTGKAFFFFFFFFNDQKFKGFLTDDKQLKTSLPYITKTPDINKDKVINIVTLCSLLRVNGFQHRPTT
jgi:hypothetical protein